MKLSDGAWSIQGVNLLDACRRFGTPLYVYDAEVIARQVARFRRAFEGLDPRILYAVKALSNLAILRLMRRLGTGLDTVSIGEVHMGLRAGFEPAEIQFTPNCEAFEEVEEAVGLGVGINLESLPSLERFGRRFGGRVGCSIRLNPHVAAERNAEKVADWFASTKFGMALSQLDAAQELARRHGVRIDGIHIHSSSQILDAEVFRRGAEVVFEVARRFERVQRIDFGGGIRVPTRAGEEVIDIDELGRCLKGPYEALCADLGRRIELLFEPGRFLVSECGSLLVGVNLVKSNGVKDFVGVDSGFNHLVRPKLYDAWHEIQNLSNPGGERRRYTVVGTMCEVDELGRDRDLEEVRPGDVLAIRNAGAYGYSMASNYNARPRPAEVLILDGEPRLIRRRETLEDLLRGQVEIEP